MYASACRRRGCIHRHRAGPRHHGHCCCTCRQGEGTHTHNCSGRGQAVHRAETGVAAAELPLAQPRGEAQPLEYRRYARTPPYPVRPACLPFFFLPESWLRHNNAMRHLDWFRQRYGVPMEMGAQSEWASLALDLHESPSAWARARRPLLLFAYAQDSVPDELAGSTVDVAAWGLDARCPRLYEMAEVTGLDFRVQAVVCSQRVAAQIVREAMQQIESRSLHRFAFVCHGATHRSVACCVLLAALCFPDASICLTTARTRLAAEQLGL